MTDKIKELLAVLDMPEYEQWHWITEGEKVIEFFPDEEVFFGDPQKYLADLAFRLNKGAIAGKKPIEWIVDALIKAKELAKAKDG